MNIQTVFLVKGETYAIAGAGQSAVASALGQFDKDTVVKLHGFIIDGEFKSVDLSSYWERMNRETIKSTSNKWS